MTIKNLFSILAGAVLVFSIFSPLFSSANGGDQRIVDGKYYINLSRAPFTPRVRVKTSFLASFVDIQKNKLMSENLIVKVRIAKLGGGAAKREFIFEKDDVVVQGGVMDFNYAFAEPGLHEIFFDFALASNPEKVYAAPDFLLDIQKPEVKSQENRQTLFMWTIGGMALGFIIGWLLKS